MTARLAAVAMMFAAIGIACWAGGERDKAGAAGLITVTLATIGLGLQWRFTRRRQDDAQLINRINAMLVDFSPRERTPR